MAALQSKVYRRNCWLNGDVKHRAYATSISSVLIPVSGCRLFMPGKQVSARMLRKASTVAAPVVTNSRLKSFHPLTMTSVSGYSARASAMGGLCVMMVARRSRARLSLKDSYRCEARALFDASSTSAVPMEQSTWSGMIRANHCLSMAAPMWFALL